MANTAWVKDPVTVTTAWLVHISLEQATNPLVVRVDCQSLQSLTGTVGRGRALTALGHIHVAPLVVVGGWGGQHSTVSSQSVSTVGRRAR